MNFLTSLLNADTLSGGAVSFLGETFNVSLGWIASLIRALVNGVGIVGVGIILFSVILKLVVLPFDVMQRINMSKQNAKMKQNQEKLKKLQKQYAHDKTMYNQKMMEMYKESGINVFSSCLPAILSIIIFIVAINNFNAYSQYANLSVYNKMVREYNAALTTHTATLDDDVSFSNGYILVEDKDGDVSGRYIYYVVETQEQPTSVEEMKTIVESKPFEMRIHYVNSTLLRAYDEQAEAEISTALALPENELEEKTLASNYVTKLAQQAVKKAYNEDIYKDTKFLWIKNIWETDASYKHPISGYSDFKSELQDRKTKLEVPGKNVKFSKIGDYTDAYTQDNYNKVTALLKSEKNSANGYYIMIALSIGTILLQQFISMRSQKEQQKFSSVDGTGAMNQKTMMIMMTVMFGIFSFMYSAAFSIYMVMSNLLSLATTVIIGKGVERKLEKEEERAIKEKYNNRFPGRKQTSTDKNSKK